MILNLHAMILTFRYNPNGKTNHNKITLTQEANQFVYQLVCS